MSTREGWVVNVRCKNGSLLRRVFDTRNEARQAARVERSRGRNATVLERDRFDLMNSTVDFS